MIFTNLVQMIKNMPARSPHQPSHDGLWPHPAHHLRRTPLLISLLLLPFLSTSLTSCTSMFLAPQPAPWGLMAPYSSLARAQIAVLPCARWPTDRRLEDKEHDHDATKVPQDLLTTVCPLITQYVLRSFTGQPSIKGLSPGIVTARLEQKSHLIPGLNNDLGRDLTERSEVGDKILSKPFYHAWHPQEPPARGPRTRLHYASPELASSRADHLSTEYFAIDHPADLSHHHEIDYYNKIVRRQPSWQLLLRSLSAITDQSDSVLLSLITEATQKKRRLSGHDTWERRVKVVFFLISTHNADIIWARKTGGTVSYTSRSVVWQNSPRGDSGSATTQPPLPERTTEEAYPSWSQVLAVIESQPLWHDFPGWTPPYPGPGPQ